MGGLSVFFAKFFQNGKIWMALAVHWERKRFRNKRKTFDFSLYNGGNSGVRDCIASKCRLG